MLHKITELIEEGFAQAILNGEEHSKKYFWQLLEIVKNASKPEEQVKASQGYDTSASRSYDKVENKREMLIVAWFLSEHGHDPIFEGRISQSVAIQKLADKLNVKPNTLKNQRDYFDSYTHSHREGWKQPLNYEQKQVHEQMSRLTLKEAKQKIDEILKTS